MKIAITSEGNTLNSQIDSRFGRCSYFAIYDTETKATEFVLNPGKEASGKTLPLLESLHIEMISETNKTISEIIKQF